MENLSKIRILKGLFAFLCVVFSYLSWWTVAEAVRNPLASDFIAPAITISLMMIILGVLLLLVKEKRNIIGIVVVVALQSVWFAPNAWHMGLVTIAVILVMGGALQIQNELNERLKLHFMYSLRKGFTPIVFSFVLLICSVYFWQINTLPLESLVPKIEFGKRVETSIYTFLGNVNPQFASLKQENISVDEFLTNIMKGQLDAQLEGTQDTMVNEILRRRGLQEEQRQEVEQFVNEDMARAVNEEKERALGKSREQFSQLAGVPLTGSEPVTDVFSLIINNKIHEMTVGQFQSSENRAVIPLVITSLLFVTIMPMATVVKYVWLMFSGAIMRMFIRFGWIKVHKISKLAEVME